ncbi:carbohydrate ABC transporter permease [Streptomyces sp. NPDC004134]|uniref:carbohydrate ABC transporter permease n=1 Tax=Streptomyces sp. NPDC004134 TaxID=3364691 RepID=UPI0036753278
MAIVTAPPARPRQAAAAAPAGRSALGTQQRRLYWVFLLPALAVYLALFIAPAVVGVYVSFQRWRGTGDEMKPVGFDNYRRLWSDDVFRTAFTNTLQIVVLCGIGIFTLAFAITVLLRQARARRTLRTLLFFPHIVSPIAIGVALGLLLAPEGLVNSTLRAVGLDAAAANWLNPDNIFRTIMVGIVWVTTGFYVILLMAGVDRIPPYYYEESELAGANEFQKFWHVTLPMTWDVVSVAAVLWVISSVKIFEFIYAFSGTGDAPPVSSRTLTIQQFLVSTGGRNPSYELGYACAMGVVMVVLILLLVTLLRRVMRRDPIQF